MEVFVFVGLNWDYDMIFYNIFINIWQIFLKVEVFVFVGLNWEDAPPEQFAVRGVDYKVIRLHIIWLQDYKVTDSFQEQDQIFIVCWLSSGAKSQFW